MLEFHTSQYEYLFNFIANIYKTVIVFLKKLPPEVIVVPTISKVENCSTVLCFVKKSVNIITEPI